MLVVERMTHAPITITQETTVEEALSIIARQNQRHLPVLDADENLVGIVSEKDLLRARLDEAVEKIMAQVVITVTEYTGPGISTVAELVFAPLNVP